MRLLLATLAAFTVTACNIQVNPSDKLALHAAQQAVREHIVSKGGQLESEYVICVGAGVIDASASPLTFTHEDSPSTGRVVWRGSGTIVSGGVSVTDFSAVAGQANTFVAQLPKSFPEGFVVRQLWIGTSRASRNVVSDASAVRV